MKKKIDESSRCGAIVIYSKKLTVNEITGLMAVMPSRASNKGEPVSKRSPKSPKLKHTYWALESALNDKKELPLHLGHLLKKAKSAKWSKLRKDAEIAFSCFGSIGSHQSILLDLDLKSLQRLAKLGISLSVDVYR